MDCGCRGGEGFEKLVGRDAEQAHLFGQSGHGRREEVFAACGGYALRGVVGEIKSHAAPRGDDAVRLQKLEGFEHGVGVDGHHHRKLAHRGNAAARRPFAGEDAREAVVGYLPVYGSFGLEFHYRLVGCDFCVPVWWRGG